MLTQITTLMRYHIEVKVKLIGVRIIRFYEPDGTVYTGLVKDFPNVKIGDVLMVAFIDIPKGWVEPHFIGIPKDALDECRTMWSNPDD